METMIHFFVETNLYLVALFLIYKGFLQNSKNYKVGRPFIQIGVLLSLLLPLLSFDSLVLELQNVNLSATLSEITIGINGASSTTQFSWKFWMAAIYVLGCTILTVKVLLQIKALFRLKSAAVEKESHFLLKQSTAAFSFMNWIFIGDSYSDSERQTVLMHEKVHVIEKHSWDILICHLLEIVFWFNPIVFQLKKLFQEIHEYQADELSWKKQDGYLHLLVHQNFNQVPSLSNQFKSSHLKLRIMRLKNEFNTKITPAKIGLTVSLFAAMFFINQNLKASSTPTAVVQTQQKEVDKVAEYPGGNIEMMKFIIGNTMYKKTMAEKGLKGKVFVQFTVLSDGSLTNIKAARSPHEELSEEAIRVVSKMPNWVPAEKDGKKVKMQMTLPINFDTPPPPPPPAPPTPPVKPTK